MDAINYRNSLYASGLVILFAVLGIVGGKWLSVAGTLVVFSAIYFFSFPQVSHERLENFLRMFEPPPEEESADATFLRRTILHRGGCTDAPENTLQAIHEAAKQGVAGVEVDLRFTADGIGILLHDDTVDRTTNGHGKVRQMTFDEIRRLDASAQHKSRYKQPVTVPTLEECVQECLKHNLLLFIDCKDSAYQTARLIDGLFKNYPLLYDTAAVCSFNPYVIYRVRAMNPRVITGLTFQKHFISCEGDCITPRRAGFFSYFTPYLDWIFNWMTYSLTWLICGNSFFLINKQSLSRVEVQWWRNLGVHVIPWTVNCEVEMRYFMDHFQVPIITDGF
ncbi:glycerophosphodiester phosphodiesterase 1-like isoform X1 [Pomacea canaliculata]|uniref:glycerophosphodiester phosphodiesterase 1-like isoform X1 n=1 Tax=Pomacea canaliculata TaxID=400727 RepID=UPI000D736EB0|nr:glycerophosphodiester phosphodiesterase 1-like isoform X1 [Pomacea canaliculata]